MKTIQFEFNGTSHGEGYSGKISGIPQGVVLDVEHINRQLALRKGGFGRSIRQSETPDIVKFFDLVGGKTSDLPLNFFVANANGTAVPPNFSKVRSGHIDVVAAAKYDTTDLRSLNERASGRNSLCYVVLGAICKQILSEQYGITTASCIKQIGKILAKGEVAAKDGAYSVDSKTLAKMQKAVQKARENGDSLGGIVKVFAQGVKIGQIGDFFPYDRRLDGIIAANMLAIPSVKGIEFGLGRDFACQTGRQTVDKLAYDNGQIAYATNRAGGIVGGITNGCEVSFELTVKPVPTVKDIETVDLASGEKTIQHFERADTCIVQTVGVVAENILAYVLLDEILTHQTL